jgi:hypothetical protein
MLRIGLASAALILVCLGTVAHLFGDSAIARKAPAGRGLAAYQPSAEAFPVILREVIWHPDPFGTSPFGFIPMDWTTRPQFIPLTWDVRTVFASNGAGEGKAGRGDFSPRVKMARVD